MSGPKLGDMFNSRWSGCTICYNLVCPSHLFCLASIYHMNSMLYFLKKKKKKKEEKRREAVLYHIFGSTIQATISHRLTL